VPSELVVGTIHTVTVTDALGPDLLAEADVLSGAAS